MTCVLFGSPYAIRPLSCHVCPVCDVVVYCGQTIGWIKMKLGTEEGLSPGDFVLDGDPAPLPKMGAEPPSNFRPMLIAAKRLDG